MPAERAAGIFSEAMGELDRLIVAVGSNRDRGAFADLYRHFAPRVKSYLLRLGADAGTAEEVMQESMLALWRRADSFDPRQASASTWVFTIARNKRIDGLRRGRRPELDPADPALMPAEPEAADRRLEAAEASRRLRQAIDTLPREQAELLQLAYYDDLSHSAIAETTKLPLGATHLALCPACRAEVGRFEAVGGALLERLEPAPIAEQGLERMLARLDEPNPAESGTIARSSLTPGSKPVLPEPLRTYLGRELDAVPWRRLARGIEEFELAMADRDSRTTLIRVKSGRALPWHTHEGQELTLVLAGGFADGNQHFARGDVAVADDAVTHRPFADPGEDCVCLTSTEGRLKLTGLLGRVGSLFMR